MRTRNSARRADGIVQEHAVLEREGEEGFVPVGSQASTLPMTVHGFGRLRMYTPFSVRGGAGLILRGNYSSTRSIRYGRGKRPSAMLIFQLALFCDV